MNRQFEFNGRLRSFQHAGRGVLITLRSQHNAWIHALATALVVIAGYGCSLSRTEWCLIVLAAAAVWTTEALNTALEFLADAAVAEFHPIVGRAKDVAAGGVLLSALGAAIVGVLIFGPHVFAWAGAIRP